MSARTAGHADSPSTLEHVRSGLKDALTATVTSVLVVAALGGIFLNIALAFIPHQSDDVRIARMGSGLLLTLIALGALVTKRYLGIRRAIAFFGIAVYVLIVGISIYLGSGVGSSAAVVPACLIVVAGFVLSARAAVWTTRVAVLGSLMLFGLEFGGWIKGISQGSAPPSLSYAVVQVIVFMTIGTVIAHFSRLFWNAMTTIEQARMELEKKVEMQDQTQARLLASERALIEHREQLEELVLERTERLALQQQHLQTIIEAMPLSMSIRGLDNRYQLCNRVFAGLAGSSMDKLIGQRVEDVFAPAVAEQIIKHDHELLSGTPLLRYEIANFLPDGSRKDYLTTSITLPDRDGNPAAIMSLTVDISEQNALLRELAASKVEAEQLAKVKSSFLVNMSHEIRTPLHGVLGLAQLGLNLPPCDPQVKTVLERISHSGKHLLGVINDILDFTKIEAGKLPIEHTPLSPRELAEDAMAVVAERARDKGLALTLHCEAAPPAVMGDPLRINQILLNLLSNAVKFTEQGEVSLTISTDERHLRFAVKDTGIGMHPDAQARVFEPFEQADGSTSRRYGGTGLGLSISKQLAQLMGGTIELVSALAEGSTFTLCIPLELTHAPAPTATPLASKEQGPRLRGLHILAADDVEINRDIVATLLEQEGAIVDCVEDGKRTVELLKQHGKGHYDIVLMDVQMPVMNGLQATELLQMRDPDLPVVALTAHAMPEETQRCKDAGMIDHLPKPFEPEDVIRMVLKWSRSKPQDTISGALDEAPPYPAPTPAPETVSTPPAPPLLDIPAALARCAGKEALLRKLLGRFLDEQRVSLPNWATWVTQEPELARRQAHTIKGSAGNLGMAALSAQAGALEEALVLRDAGQIDAALVQFQAALQTHLEALAVWLAADKS
ncbi:ATP-binding protein [Aquabacterium sp.]|uniref:hybrid sensor histidine kinase/response regulator n=1 Tax=Aquabacterium sp. TaxID=1872578 RepID=UPI003B740EB2